MPSSVCRSLLGATLALAVLATPASAAPYRIPTVRVSSDTSTDPGAQHNTELEVDSQAFGRTVVGVYQAGRFNAGGSSAAGKFAVSTNAGRTWATGILPGLTTSSTPAGPHPRVVDENVAYDRRSHTWLISSVPVDKVGASYALPGGSSYQESAVLTSRSTDGGRTWSDPVVVAAPAAGFQPDKQWTACDNTPSSHHYGTCYAAYSDTHAISTGAPIEVRRSTDGGATWSTARTRTGIPSGYNAQPIVQPNGRLVIVATDIGEQAILATSSSDGGLTFSDQVTVSPISGRKPAGLRTFFKPSVDLDASGRVWVTWQDCRFRSGCGANDVVLTSSKNGASWTKVKRVPVDATTSTVDHLIPGLGIDRRTSGASTRMGITFNYIPDTRCNAPGRPACLLGSAYISSEDGGATWSAPTTIGAPVAYTNYPQAAQGRMPGDYESVAFADHVGVTLFPVASAPTGGRLNVDMRAALPPPLTAKCSLGAKRKGKRTVRCKLSHSVPSGSRLTLRIKHRAVAKGRASGRKATVRGAAKRIRRVSSTLSGSTPNGSALTFAATF